MSQEIIDKYFVISETIVRFDQLSNEDRVEVFTLSLDLRRPIPYAKLFKAEITLRRFIEYLIEPKGAGRKPREKLLEKTTKEYMIGRQKRTEIVEKLVQLTKYRKGIEEMMGTEEYYSMPEWWRKMVIKELEYIEEWTQNNKDLKI